MALSVGTWTTQNAGSSLNLDGYVSTFTDEFNDMSIAAGGTSTRWYSDSLFDFGGGGATFVDDTGPNGPFSVSGGYLTITMEHKNGRWESGGIQTVNRSGQGFSQQYGYFEVKAKFPERSEEHTSELQSRQYLVC